MGSLPQGLVAAIAMTAVLTVAGLAADAADAYAPSGDGPKGGDN